MLFYCLTHFVSSLTVMWLMGGTETLQAFQLLVFFFYLVPDNDVSNQQYATIFVYWSFYSSIWICSTCFGRQIRPSSGALFDCIYSFGTMHRYCCRPVTRFRWNFHLNLVTGRQQYRCIIPKLYIQSKSAPEDGRVCRPKHVEQIQIDE